MKELTTAALYLVEGVLQSPNAFQKNMKITCEEVMKISNHFLESSQKLSSHMKNQEHYTNSTSSRPTKPQSEWINLMHGDQSLKTLNFQHQKKQLKPCETYKQSYNAKLKYALDNQPKITTGQIREKMFEFKTKKPEESSSNWKPWHKDWNTITSNHSEEYTINDNGKYRYNMKGFLEDDESSDDSILIVDSGWDDYFFNVMSERFEQEIQYWYDNSRTVDPEYIVFNETSPKPTPTDLANNLACVYSRLNLFSKVALKNYKSISEKQKELESRVQNCQEKLESCEELLRKTQSETRKSLQQISTEIQQSKPLTKREVLNLVQEIAEQPKLVEKEALRLTEDLNQKIQKVEHLLHEVKKLITG
ncbi:heme peroxidase [Tanacetum coccineum]